MKLFTAIVRNWDDVSKSQNAPQRIRMLHLGFTSFDGTKSASVSGVPVSDCPRIDISLWIPSAWPEVKLKHLEFAIFMGTAFPPHYTPARCIVAERLLFVHVKQRRDRLMRKLWVTHGYVTDALQGNFTRHVFCYQYGTFDPRSERIGLLTDILADGDDGNSGGGWCWQANCRKHNILLTCKQSQFSASHDQQYTLCLKKNKTPNCCP